MKRKGRGVSVSTFLIVLSALLSITGMLIAFTLTEKERQAPINVGADYDPIAIFEKTSLNTSCFGITRYYTGKGFQNDLALLTRDYDMVYNNESGNAIDDDFELLPPYAIVMGAKGIDCEDMTHFTICLAGMYPNIFCEPTLTSPVHLEAKCYEAKWS